MENENTNEKKKQIRLAIIGVVALLLLTLGATFAFFQISTVTESSNTNITGSTPPKSLVTLREVTSNLHLNISASDMSLANANNEYYATDVEGKSYEDNEEDGTKTIAEVELTGGEETTRYRCSAKLTVSKVTEPEEDKDTMIEVLQPWDLILQFKGNILSEELDLSELNPSGKKEYNLSFEITGNKIEKIQAYIGLYNSWEEQNYLAGKRLNIDISTSDLKCSIFIPNTKLIAQLREKSDGKLSDELVYGLYRYQGNSIVTNIDVDSYNGRVYSMDKTDTVNNNYICLGSDCSSADSDDMYRIIGINEDGEMKVIKNTPAATDVVWSKYRYDDFSWPSSEIFGWLNGLHPIIRPEIAAIRPNNSYENSLYKSLPVYYSKPTTLSLSSSYENGFYNLLPIELQEKIINTKWNYGDVIDPNDNEENQNIFTSEELAKYNELYGAIYGTEENEYESELNDDQKRDKIKEISKMYSEALMKIESELTDNVKANIGLMSLTDFCGSFENNSTYNCMTSFYYGSLDEVKNEDYGVTWLIANPEWNDGYGEWTMMSNRSLSDFEVWELLPSGYVRGIVAWGGAVARPVFFLTSDIELSGDGTIEDPFTIGIE